MIAAPYSLRDHFPPVTTADWLAAVRQAAGSAEELDWDCDGLSVRPLYRAADIEAPPDPGITGGWDICERIDADDPAGVRAAAMEALDGGAHALAFGGPLGAPRAELEALLRGLVTRGAALHWEGPSASALDSLLKCAPEGADLRGSLVSEPVTCRLRGRRSTSYDRLAALAEKPGAPGFRALGIDAAALHERGAGPLDELALALAAARELLIQLADRGLPAARTAGSISFRVAIGPSFFPEIAKLRALRLMARQLFDDSGAPEADVDVFAVATTYWHAGIDHRTNLVRATTQAIAAVIGGCDTLLVPPLAGLNARSSRQLQLMLAHEAHLGRVADAAAGSYFMEHLTDRLARAAWDRFRRIESRGGLLEMERSGALKDVLGRALKERDAQYRTASRSMVGVNAYASLDSAPEISPGTGPAAPFEALRRRTRDRPPRAVLLRGGSGLLRRLARDVLATAGIACCEEEPGGDSGVPDMVVAALPGHDTANLSRAQPHPVVAVTEERPPAPVAGAAACLYPGMDIPAVMGGLLDTLGYAP